MAAIQSIKRVATLASLTVMVGGLAAACGGGTASNSTDSGADSSLSGQVAVDGSSTVFPVTEAMAEEYQNANSGVRITVGVSGTGGGFKKFCAGETDISNASRPIKAEEAKLCTDAGIEFIELPIAYDAVSVVVNPENNWAQCLTTDELSKMWAPAAQGTVTSWKQIRDSFPDEPLQLYGPGTDSGTFDYFTDAVNGEEGASRGDYTASEDDNVVVQGVSGSKGGLGYFGYAYYEENKDKVNVVAIDNKKPDDGEGCIEPSEATVVNTTYQPLARPIFIYVSKPALEKPEVKSFVEFYLNNDNRQYVAETGYVPLTEEIYGVVSKHLADQKVGSAFPGGSVVGVDLAKVYASEL
ncbi:PstS family phosphate ABC transporter substrate-binding protein [Lyngbya confervoides]|uniref:Phosphate-binding protein n=1 Tax=Lyngbya confervoides BDU141951 TaxID=1574623 RepID=A0ABD4T7X8_9CYAN|nr:PstS family phosphate ABC transporter substrate-binding protein [Lyngbya confervoides]MCM1984370.1 PstS family phosphate ABC transporter substrate-binding protein [Lyngbya confervoides BDU141951]